MSTPRARKGPKTGSARAIRGPARGSGASRTPGKAPTGTPKRKASKRTATYIDFIDEVCQRDVTTLRLKDAAYGGSWIKRGGVNAYCMLARKIDRIEQRVCRGKDDDGDPVYVSIFTAIREDEERGRAETVLEDIGDLRRYLCLIESEWKRRQSRAKKQSTTARKA